MNSQKGVKEKFKMPASTPDLVLEGHEEVADYALAWSSVAPILASGGKDKKILLWDIEKFLVNKGVIGQGQSNGNGPVHQEEEELAEEQFGGLVEEEVKLDVNIDISDEINSQLSFANKERRRDAKQELKKKLINIQPRQIKEIGDYLNPVKTVQKNLLPFARLIGHTNSVEDVVFKPGSEHELVSVGVDKKILFWDTRVKNIRGEATLTHGFSQPTEWIAGEIVGPNSLRQKKVTELNPSFRLLNVHNDDINTVAWSALNTNYVATGSNDKKVCLIDVRKFSSSSEKMDIKTLAPDQSPIVKVLTGHTESITGLQFCPFDQRYLISSAESVKIWNLEEQEKDEQLFFDHIGHINRIADVQWSEDSPWSILSVSDDMDPRHAGCSLQAFRPVDLLTMP